MIEDSVKNLEIELKKMNLGFSLEADPKGHFYFIRYFSPCGGKPMDMGTINSSSKEFINFSNGNIPLDISDSLEKGLLEKGYRITSKVNFGIIE